jgi:hypothetical protein
MDIRVIGIDKEQSYQQDKKKPARVVFVLSEKPNEEWEKYFKTALRSTHPTIADKVRISEQFIIFDSNFEPSHLLEGAKMSARSANERFDTFESKLDRLQF